MANHDVGLRSATGRVAPEVPRLTPISKASLHRQPSGGMLHGTTGRKEGLPRSKSGAVGMQYESRREADERMRQTYQRPSTTTSSARKRRPSSAGRGGRADASKDTPDKPPPFRSGVVPRGGRHAADDDASVGSRARTPRRGQRTPRSTSRNKRTPQKPKEPSLSDDEEDFMWAPRGNTPRGEADDSKAAAASKTTPERPRSASGGGRGRGSSVNGRSSTSASASASAAKAKGTSASTSSDSDPDLASNSTASDSTPAATVSEAPLKTPRQTPRSRPSSASRSRSSSATTPRSSSSSATKPRYGVTRTRSDSTERPRSASKKGRGRAVQHEAGGSTSSGDDADGAAMGASSTPSAPSPSRERSRASRQSRPPPPPISNQNLVEQLKRLRNQNRATAAAVQAEKVQYEEEKVSQQRSRRLREEELRRARIRKQHFGEDERDASDAASVGAGSTTGRSASGSGSGRPKTSSSRSRLHARGKAGAADFDSEHGLGGVASMLDDLGVFPDIGGLGGAQQQSRPRTVQSGSTTASRARAVQRCPVCKRCFKSVAVLALHRSTCDMAAAAGIDFTAGASVGAGARMNRRKMGVDEEESEDEDEGSGAKTGSRAGTGAGGRGATEPQPQPDTSGARPGTSAGPETEGSPVGSRARTGRPVGEPSSPRRPGETDEEREKRKWQERFKEWKATKGAGPADVRGNVPGRPAPVPGSDPNEAPGDQYASRRPSSSTSVPMNTFFMRSYGPWSSTAADREESERKAKEETERRRRERAEQSARVMHDRDRKNAEHDRMLVTLHRIRWSEFELAASKAKQAGSAQGGEPGPEIAFDDIPWMPVLRGGGRAAGTRNGKAEKFDVIGVDDNAPREAKKKALRAASLRW